MRTSQHTIPAFLFKAPLTLTVLVVAASACDCGRIEVDTNHPEFRASATALDFEACPAIDDEGQLVEDALPASKTFTIDNVGGKATGSVNLTIEGDGKDRFSINQETLPGSIAAGSTGDVEVIFTPTTQGSTASASLVIDDGDVETEPIRVALSGSATNLPARPTIAISRETQPGVFEDCVAGISGSIDNCMLQFPEISVDQSTSLKVKVQSLGCQPLKITGLELGPATQAAFALEQPATPPTAEVPLTLSVLEGTPETELVVRFDARDDGSGDGQRYATLAVKSNAKASPESLFTLSGNVGQPAIYITPSFCDFTDPASTCSVLTTGTNRQAVFRIFNGGNTDVTIETVAFRPGASGRFAVGGTNPQGQTIASGEWLPLVIDYTDAALYVTDLLDVTAANNAGVATIRVSGGVLPKLSTTPAPPASLDFSDQTLRTSVKPVQICNQTGSGALVLNRVQVIQGPSFFSVKTPVAAGTEILGGTCLPVDIEFTRPVSGGMQAGTLEIESNDPDFAAPSHFRLGLYSSVDVDHVPTAVLEGPAGQTTSFSVSLQTLNPKRVTLVGTNSYDATPSGNVPVTEYKFFLVAAPGATATLTQGGTAVHNVKTTTGTVDLNLDPAKIGEYKVYLTVYDAVGQASNASELKIVVTQ